MLTSVPHRLQTFNINVQAVLKVVGDIKNTLVVSVQLHDSILFDTHTNLSF